MWGSVGLSSVIRGLCAEKRAAERAAGQARSGARSANPVGLLSTGLELAAGRQLLVPAELLPHGREHLVGKMIFAARGESLKQRSCKHRSRNPDVDGRLHCPATLARVGHPPGKALQSWVGLQSSRRQV